MTERTLSYRDLVEIVELIKSSSQFAQFRLKTGDIEVELVRANGDGSPASNGAAPPHAAPVQQRRHPHVGGGELAEDLAATPPSAPAVASTSPPSMSPVQASSASDKATTRGSGTRPPEGLPEAATIVKSPMVGTFYRAPEPGAPAFVEVGAAVNAGATLCIIEVMKLMNSLPAPVDGVVTRILANDGDAVEYGQPLLVVEPR